MNAYQQEQLDALHAVRDGLSRLGDARRQQLMESVRGYIEFRRSVDAYLQRHFEGICTRNCFESRTSACCAKDSIITFFADAVINALFAAPQRLGRMEAVLRAENPGHRCVYLTGEGCLWSIRPVVCAMFLCDSAMRTVFDADPRAETDWRNLRRREKLFKWPDRPVLFDHLERVFMDLGYRSTLMHLNFSPGLLRVKRDAGLS
ncbi:MAG TPA: hypothetical protein VLT88_15675 [Desulfosarcina sp.]|nr:hypothetical protein [Desulfosarcina sp.]